MEEFIIGEYTIRYSNMTGLAILADGSAIGVYGDTQLNMPGLLPANCPQCKLFGRDPRINNLKIPCRIVDWHKEMSIVAKEEIQRRIDFVYTNCSDKFGRSF